jgi:serine phosphatase RsbU (regulator of sigma subunit)
VDPAGREFGEIGVLQVVSSFPDAKPADLATEILEAAARFTGAAPAADDRTVVVLRFNGVKAESAWTGGANEVQFTAA